MLMRIRSQHFSLTRIPYFAGKETRNLLLNYLDMTREIIEHQMNGEYDQSIDTFRDLSDLVLELADYLARGLLAR